MTPKKLCSLGPNLTTWASLKSIGGNCPQSIVLSCVPRVSKVTCSRSSHQHSRQQNLLQPIDGCTDPVSRRELLLSAQYAKSWISACTWVFSSLGLLYLIFWSWSCSCCRQSLPKTSKPGSWSTSNGNRRVCLCCVKFVEYRSDGAGTGMNSTFLNIEMLAAACKNISTLQ